MGPSDIFKKKTQAEILQNNSSTQVDTVFNSPQFMDMKEMDRCEPVFSESPYKSLSEKTSAFPPPDVHEQKEKHANKLMPASAKDVISDEKRKRMQSTKKLLLENVEIDSKAFDTNPEMTELLTKIKKYAQISTDIYTEDSYEQEKLAEEAVIQKLMQIESELNKSVPKGGELPPELMKQSNIVQMYKSFFHLDADGLLKMPDSTKVEENDIRRKNWFKEVRSARKEIKDSEGKKKNIESEIKKLVESDRIIKEEQTKLDFLEQEQKQASQALSESPEDAALQKNLEDLNKAVEELKLNRFEFTEEHDNKLQAEHIKTLQALLDSPEDVQLQDKLMDLEVKLSKTGRYLDLSKELEEAEKNVQLNKQKLADVKAREVKVDYYKIDKDTDVIADFNADEYLIAKGKLMDKTNQPLFPHEPSPSDVKQGRVGDCYLLAALASIAASNPDAIKECMKDNGDGSVTVRLFFEKKEFALSNGHELSSEVQPYYVTVKKEVPSIFFGSRSIEDPYAKRAFWVQIIEKAYAASRLHIKLQEQRYTQLSLRENDLEKKKRYAEEKTKFSNKLMKSPRYSDIKSGFTGEFVFAITGRKGNMISDSNRIEKRNLSKMYNIVADQAVWAAQVGVTSKVFAGDAKIDKNSSAQKAAVFDESQAFNNYLTKNQKNLPGMTEYKNKVKNKAPIIDLARYVTSAEMEEYLQKNREEIINSMPLRTWITDTVQQKKVRELVFENFVKEIVVQAKKADVFEPFSTTNYSVESKNTFNKIEKSLKDKELVTCGSKEYIPKDAKAGGGGLNSESMQAGIIEGHAYTVLDTNTSKNGFKYIKLRNPWGRAGQTYIHDDKTGKVALKMDELSESDGTFFMELNDFMARFNQVYIN